MFYLVAISCDLYNMYVFLTFIIHARSMDILKISPMSLTINYTYLSCLETMQITCVRLTELRHFKTPLAFKLFTTSKVELCILYRFDSPFIIFNCCLNIESLSGCYIYQSSGN